MANTDRENALSPARTPLWATAKAKAIAGSLAALGALVSGVAGVPFAANLIRQLFNHGDLDGWLRGGGLGLAFIGASWALIANLKEKTEVDRLRKQLAKAQADGLSHATAAFRDSVSRIASANASGWTPETVKIFQPDALRFGKSLFDYIGIPDARVCLYEPGAMDLEPEATTTANITTLNFVSATYVPGRHHPSATIVRSATTKHLFNALYQNKPHHNEARRVPKSAPSNSKRWRSSICLGVKAENEPFALLTVDSTVEKAFDNVAEGVLVLLGELLQFAEAEKDRALMTIIRVPDSKGLD